MSFCLVTLALAAAPGRSQQGDDFQLWLGTMLSGRFGARDSEAGRYRWWLEAQDRQRDDWEHFALGFVRPALGYDLHPRLTFWAGYAYLANDVALREPFDEHRLWQQLSWNLPVDFLPLHSRSRLEQRFVETGAETGWRYRQLLKAAPALSSNGRLYASLWDEVFVDLNDTRWGQRQGLRQNRAFAGLGLHLDEARSKTLEVGYLNQWIDRRGRDNTVNHGLVVWLTLNF